MTEIPKSGRAAKRINLTSRIGAAFVFFLFGLLTGYLWALAENSY